MIKSLASAFHGLLSRLPWCARVYLGMLHHLTSALPLFRRQQVLNSLSSADWGTLQLPAREVTLAGDVKLWLYPHQGEFDFEAVLGGKLSYEHEVFDFLDGVISRYDAVVDIGANVGVFTCWFGKRMHGRGKVYAFDPSRKVFGRLLENVERNDLDNVQVFNCAVGKDSGFALFTEPEGHLTNGSLVESFARQFSQTVKKSAVTVIGADQLATLLAEHQRVLIKIDTEGFEAVVLEALAPVLARWKPDLVIEVLPEFEAELNGVKILSELGYHAHSITPEGLQRTGRITATHWRDCFLSVETGS
jgi:FkbM family methyltransferase